MLVQKNRYLSGLLMVILLASASMSFASENFEQPSWWQRARNIGSSTYDYASRRAQSAWDYAKPYAPYAPAAALAGLGMYGATQGPRRGETALLTGLFGTPLAATLARYYNRLSQTPEQRSSNWWDLAQTAIPGAMTAYAVAKSPYPENIGGNALMGAAIGSIPALALSRYLAYREPYIDLNQFKQIRDNLQKAVLTNLNDMNPNNTLVNDNNIKELINAYVTSFELMRNNLSPQELLSARAFIEQQLLNYMFNGGMIDTNGALIDQNEDDALIVASKLLPWTLDPLSVAFFANKLQNPDIRPPVLLAELLFDYQSAEPAIEYPIDEAATIENQIALKQIDELDSKIAVLKLQLTIDAVEKRKKDFESMGNLPKAFEAYNDLITHSIQNKIHTLEMEKADLFDSMQ